MANRPFPAARTPGVREPLFVRRTACFRPSGERQRYSEACASVYKFAEAARQAQDGALCPLAASLGTDVT